MNVTVATARTATPGTPPVSLLKPEAMSSASTGAGVASMSSMARRGSPSGARKSPVPSTPSTTTSAAGSPCAGSGSIGTPAPSARGTRGPGLVGLGRSEGQHAGLQAGLTGRRRKHVAVTAVVAAPADDEDAPRRRPPAPQRPEGGTARPLHQGRRRNSVQVDGSAIERAGLFRGPQRLWQSGHGAMIVVSAKSAKQPPRSRGTRRPCQAVGERARLSAGRHCGHRPAGGRAAPARVAR